MTAATTGLSSNLRSDGIKTMLVAMMNDEAEDQETRIQAHFALTRYALTGADHDNFNEFSRRLDAPVDPER